MPPAAMKKKVPLNVPVSAALKDAVDRAAIANGQTTNEWVAASLAATLGRPELAVIPRKPVHRWMAGNPKPKGPAAILMRIWLEEARLAATGI